MTAFAQTINPFGALGLHLQRQFVEPVKKRKRLVLRLPEEKDFCLRQPYSLGSHYCELLSKATMLTPRLAIAAGFRCPPLRVAGRSI